MNKLLRGIMSARVLIIAAALALMCATLATQAASQSAAQASRPAAPAPQAARPAPAAAQATADGLPQTIEFNRDIRPILSDKCFKCHGPGTQLATLRFDLEEGAKHELKGGRYAALPGDPAKSEMIRRITAANPAVRMPKSGIGGVSPGDPLSAREIALLTKWIEQGAKWEKHWSFNPPTRPAVPAVSDPKWVRNPIDAFVLRRLDREALKPSPPADKGVLLRRVTLDLTGLPPTLLELDAFLNDTSPNAYEKAVDRLLQSPRYGERMAFPWLEAARYADSSGYFRDGARVMWRWRDWVINAFNRNMPYDQFVIEQLAGDLLPDATLEQKIATGFNRNHRGNSEAGIIDEEYLVESVVDRADTASTVFLGLSMGCSRCHNHKYDPITQKDYYSLFAYFNNVDERGHARRVGNSPPFMTAPTPEQMPVLKERDAEVASTREAFAKLQPEIVKAQKEWEAKLDRSAPIAWGPARGLIAHYPFDGDLSVRISVSQDGNPTTLKFQDGDAGFAPGRIGQAASFDGKRFVLGGDLTGFTSHVGDGTRSYSWDDPYTLAAWIYPDAPSGLIITKSKSDNVVDDAGIQLKLIDGRVGFTLRTELEEAILVESEKTVSLNQWHQVTLSYNGNRWASGIKLYVDGELWTWKVIQDDLNEIARRGDPIRIGSSDLTKDRFRGSIDDVRIYGRALSAEEAAVLADSTPITDIAALPEEKRTKAQAEKIREYFLAQAAPAPMRTALTRMLDAQRRRDDYYNSLPTVMVMEEKPTPRQSHILVRGMYDRPGDPVTPSLPAILAPASAASYPPNRLGLARWLVSAENPLTARVTVNRFWQLYFGTGIVKSVENFGSQGEQPSHPELLDWLATEFVRSGWDVKALQKTIVMSATYQQRSSATRAMWWERDPDNRLLARGPNNRLTAEMVRDQALALAGLLVNKTGGPSVKPYQAPGLWSEVGEGEGLDRDVYVQDHGDNLYRRSMYTYWKRSAPPPGMTNFDAAIREAHEVRITATNTPLQALDLMNDVTFVEAARVFAERAMREGGKTPRDRIAWAFRAATTRQPDQIERSVLLEAFQNTLATYTRKPEDALKFVSHGEYPRDPYLNVPELAAYTTVTSLILNLNQTIVKE
jgi:hypothetical protein